MLGRGGWSGTGWVPQGMITAPGATAPCCETQGGIVGVSSMILVGPRSGYSLILGWQQPAVE